MSMNYFAFFPALINEATNPNAKGTGFFANPAGPDGDQFAALGGQGISIVSYSQNQEEAFKFLEWFIKDETQKKWAELGGYTCQRQAVLEVGGIPERDALQQGLLRDDVQGEGLLGGAGICRAAASQMNQRIYPYITGDQGTAKEALDALAADWNATFKKYGRVQVIRRSTPEGARARPLPFYFKRVGGTMPWPLL